MSGLHHRIFWTASLLALAVATPAHAQADAAPPPDSPASQDEAAQDEQSGQVVEVTGSRIRRPTLTSVVPITSLSGDDLVGHGDVSLGDALNDLPALASTFSQANSTRFIGTAGLNILDLRDLAPERTLVLVNGRRHVTSVAGAFFVDINTIPEDLLERVDIVTGGSSAVYGSDAMGGVVNFVLRRDFEGLRARAQAGISDEGDRGIQFITLTGGRNFAGGRGNIAVSLEYVNAEPLYFTSRPRVTGAYDGRCQFQQVDNTVGEPAAGDGIFDNTFLCGIRNAAISNGGTVGQINAAGDYLRFNDGGSLFIDIPTRSFRPVGSGNQQGGFGSTLRDTGQLAAGLDRYTANLLARFEVSPGFQPFLEAKYVHIDAVQEAQPSFFQGLPVGCDNAFLSAQSLAMLQSFGLCASPAQTFPLSRFNVDFGGRQQLITRDTWRVVAGVEGDFNDDWHYEVAVNYGRFKGHTDALNDLVLADLNGNDDGFSLAYDAVRNAAGQIVCRVNQVAVTRPDCVPINLFGFGAPSRAALDFVNTISTLDDRASQLNVTAFMAGDLSQLFELPGGPIRFVVGAEWRRETTSQRADALSSSGGTFFNAFPTFTPPDFEVLEGFGEVELPLLRDMPFARELTVTGALRYSNYNTDADRTFAWNISGTWSPVRDIRFRANYSRSVRVPTLGDLYTPATQGFALVQDPCDQAFINNGPNRAANCAALGVPTTVLAGSPCITPATPVGSPFRNCVSNSQTIGFTVSGNPTLQEETANSLTLGVVFTPSFLPGFSLTVDYYRIRVNNLISALTAQQILNLCADQSDINNQFCVLINPRNQFGLFANQEDVLLSGGVNFARQDSRGIDFDLAYRHGFGNGHVLNVRAIATWVLERTDFVNPTDPTFGDRLLSEVGDPAFAANFQLEYGAGPWDLRYTLNYIGRQTVPVAYESQHSFQGRPPTNADLSDREWYPDLFIHGIRLGYRVNEQFRFYAGIDNFTDRLPPLGLLGTGGGEGVDAIGRYFYAGVLVNWR